MSNSSNPPGPNNHSNFLEKLGFFIGIVILLILIALALGFIILLVWGAITAWNRFTHMTHDEWKMLGEILRNATGVLALSSALLTAFIMHRTNKTRAREAVSSEFRDQMKWAVDGLASNDPIKTTYAQMILQRYANKKPKLLSKKDHIIVQEMWILSEKLYGEDTDDALESRNNSRQNEKT